MHLKGRHVLQDSKSVAPMFHDAQGVGKQIDLIGEAKPNGVIRLDDNNHPEFWIEIVLSPEEIKTLAKKLDDQG